jgi:hypothetical protein
MIRALVVAAVGILAARKIYTESALNSARFTRSQVAVLQALANTFVSTLSASETQQLLDNCSSLLKNSANTSVNEGNLREYAQRDADSARAVSWMLAILAQNVPHDILRKLKVVLWLLSTRIGCFLLCWQRFAGFHDLSISQREAVLLQWSRSWIPDIRGLFKVFKTLSLVCTYCHLPDGKTNPFWPLIGYDGPDPQRPSIQADSKYEPQFIDAFKLPLENGVRLISCDVAIIGSGCGGSVVGISLHLSIK